MAQPSRRALLTGSLGATAFAPFLFGAESADAAISVPPTGGTASYFLKISGIPGESTDRAHAGAIDVLDWRSGVTNPTSTLSTAQGPSRSKASNLVFVHHYDKASPLLFLACATGKHLTNAVLTVRELVADRQVDNLKVTLNDVFVTSVQQALDDEDGTPLEQVSLNYGKITFSYVPVAPDGTPGTAITGGFDFILNRTT